MVFFAEQPKIGQKTANGKHSYCWNDVNPSEMTIIPLKLLARHASFTTIPNWLHSHRLSRYFVFKYLWKFTYSAVEI